MQDWYNNRVSIHVHYHVSRLNKKNHDYFKKCRKSIDKIPHSIDDKTLRQIGIERTSSPDKGLLQKTCSQRHTYDLFLPLNMGNKAGTFPLTIPHQQHAESHRKCNKTTKVNKGIQIGKE